MMMSWSRIHVGFEGAEASLYQSTDRAITPPKPLRAIRANRRVIPHIAAPHAHTHSVAHYAVHESKAVYIRARATAELTLDTALLAPLPLLAPHVHCAYTGVELTSTVWLESAFAETGPTQRVELCVALSSLALMYVYAAPAVGHVVLLTTPTYRYTNTYDWLLLLATPHTAWYDE